MFEEVDWIMKKAIIIHGCPLGDWENATYNKHWIPWTKGQLEKEGFVVKTPLMPEPWDPVYSEWKKEFEKLAVDSDTVLIGHSGGTTFLVRWLGETERKIKKLILIAPWKISWEEAKKSKEFCDFAISPEIKNNVGEIVYFTSNDEDSDGKKSLEMYREVIGGKVMDLKDHGHYCLEDMGTEEFPELIEVVLG